MGFQGCFEAFQIRVISERIINILKSKVKHFKRIWGILRAFPWDYEVFRGVGRHNRGVPKVSGLAVKESLLKLPKMPLKSSKTSPQTPSNTFETLRNPKNEKVTQN